MVGEESLFLERTPCIAMKPNGDNAAVCLLGGGKVAELSVHLPTTK